MHAGPLQSRSRPHTHIHCVHQTLLVSSVPGADAFCEETSTVYHCKFQGMHGYEHLKRQMHPTIRQVESAAMRSDADSHDDDAKTDDHYA